MKENEETLWTVLIDCNAWQLDTFQCDYNTHKKVKGEVSKQDSFNLYRFSSTSII